MKTREDEPWPEADLEALPACEVCGGTERPLWLDGLADRVFGVAPGRWQMRLCRGCGVAALDPRPTMQSIGRAYTSYYTHEARPERHFIVPGDRPDLPVKRALHADFYARRYGHRLSPRLPGGHWLIAASPAKRARAGHYIRHLPAPAGAPASLLDVGCGNGSFLRVARALGFEAEGVEIDDAAGGVARAEGFAVQSGALDAVTFDAGRFEHIALNHVLEHLHRPLQALRRLHGWLRPGGRLWLQTPNRAARGCVRYGADWRGCEPPRHLVLFDAPGLMSALGTCGFERAALLPPMRDSLFFIQQSEAIARREDPYRAGRATPAQRALAREWDAAAAADWGSAEAITVQAWRPATAV